MYELTQVQNLVSTGVLNLMKDSFSVLALVFFNVLSKLEVSFFAIIMIPLAAGLAKN